MKRTLFIIRAGNLGYSPIKEGKELLEKEGVVVDARTSETVSKVSFDELNAYDLCVVFGGDGTMIETARAFLGTQTPLFGVNLGHLGYLTAVEPKDFMSGLDAILKGNFTIEERITLKAVHAGKEYVGINDVVVHRGATPRPLLVAVDINGGRIGSLTADGILVATPTGSTAYNLSAGGPLIVPTAKNLVVTPICAHTMSAEPVVVGETDKIRVEVSGVADEAVLHVDGHSAGKIISPVNVCVGEKNLRLVRIKSDSFYRTLRSKFAEREN